MKVLAAMTALPVAATGVATGEWLYLVYVVAVLFALFAWRPSWLGITPPHPFSSPSLRTLRLWRAVLASAAGMMLFVVGNAYVTVITHGDGLRAAVLFTLATFALLVAALLTHRRVEETL